MCYQVLSIWVAIIYYRDIKRKKKDKGNFLCLKVLQVSQSRGEELTIPHELQACNLAPNKLM